MSGFFSQLTQRTLGTAQTIRPSIAPRFAQAQPLTNELSPDDPSAEYEQQNNKTSNRTENKKSPPPVTEPITELVQTKKMDSSFVQDNPRQIESRQMSPTESTPGLYKSPSERQERDANLVKLETLKTKNHINPVKPIVEPKQDTETGNIPIVIATKTQIVSKDRDERHGQPDLTKDKIIKKTPFADKPLVPMPSKQPQDLENSSPPMDLHLPLDFNERNSLNQSKLQGQSDSQTINVTIGRVEVRAVHPTPPAPMKQSKVKNKSTLSLDDYLQQRQKGER